MQMTQVTAFGEQITTYQGGMQAPVMDIFDRMAHQGENCCVWTPDAGFYTERELDFLDSVKTTRQWFTGPHAQFDRPCPEMSGIFFDGTYKGTISDIGIGLGEKISHALSGFHDLSRHCLGTTYTDDYAETTIEYFDADAATNSHFDSCAVPQFFCVWTLGRDPSTVVHANAQVASDRTPMRASVSSENITRVFREQPIYTYVPGDKVMEIRHALGEITFPCGSAVFLTCNTWPHQPRFHKSPAGLLCPDGRLLAMTRLGIR